MEILGGLLRFLVCPWWAAVSFPHAERAGPKLQKMSPRGHWTLTDFLMSLAHQKGPLPRGGTPTYIYIYIYTYISCNTTFPKGVLPTAVRLKLAAHLKNGLCETGLCWCAICPPNFNVVLCFRWSARAFSREKFATQTECLRKHIFFFVFV